MRRTKMELAGDELHEFTVLVGIDLWPPAVIGNENTLGMLNPPDSLDEIISLVGPSSGNDQFWIEVLLDKRFQKRSTILHASAAEQHDICMRCHDSQTASRGA